MTYSRRGSNNAAVPQTCAMMGRPPSLCRTLARRDFMRVPRPAARIRTSRLASNPVFSVICSSMASIRKLELCANKTLRTCSSGAFHDDASQAVRVVTHHFAPVQKIGADDFSVSINNSEVIFVQADLISAVGAIYLSLLRANRAIIHHHIIEA